MMEHHRARIEAQAQHALAQLCAAQEADAASAGPCKRCWWAGQSWGDCHAPLAIKAVHYDATSGKAHRSRPSVSEARGASGACGPEGLLFRPIRWWQRPRHWSAGTYVAFVIWTALLGEFAFMRWMLG